MHSAVLSKVIFTGESTTAINLTSSVAGVTYSWIANEPSGNLIGLSQTSGDSDQILSETLVNNTSGPLVLTYVITPILDGVELFDMMKWIGLTASFDIIYIGVSIMTIDHILEE